MLLELHRGNKSQWSQFEGGVLFPAMFVALKLGGILLFKAKHALLGINTAISQHEIEPKDHKVAT